MKDYFGAYGAMTDVVVMKGAAKVCRVAASECPCRSHARTLSVFHPPTLSLADKVTGNGRGFGFVTFADVKGIVPHRLQTRGSQGNVGGKGLVVASKMLRMLPQFSVPRQLFWRGRMADRVVAARHEIRGRSVGRCISSTRLYASSLR
eukprot:3187069-Rhodomonas_salina.1